MKLMTMRLFCYSLIGGLIFSGGFVFGGDYDSKPTAVSIVLILGPHYKDKVIVTNEKIGKWTLPNNWFNIVEGYLTYKMVLDSDNLSEGRNVFTIKIGDNSKVTILVLSRTNDVIAQYNGPGNIKFSFNYDLDFNQVTNFIQW